MRLSALWKRGTRAHAAGTVDVPALSHVGSGLIPLVGSLGRPRYATFRGVYQSNPFAYAAVTMLARSLARTPLHVYALDERGRKDRVRGDVPARGRPGAGAQLDRLLSNPVGRSRFALWNATLVDRLVYGNALWEILRPLDGGLPTGIRRIRWRDVTEIVEASDGTVAAYGIVERPATVGLTTPITLPTRNRVLAAGDVVHFGLQGDSDGPAGLSPLQACRHTLALHDAVMRHVIAYFGNSARPSGHLKVEQLTTDKAEQIRTMVTQMLTSPENAGKLLITSGDFQPMATSPEHSQVVELVLQSQREIATAFQIPPPMLGILEDTNKATAKELRGQYVRDTVGGYASELEDEIEAQLLPASPAWASLFVEFQLAEQLRPDPEARSEMHERTRHLMSIDEQRAVENLPPLDLPGLSDVPWTTPGSQPLGGSVIGEPASSRNGDAETVTIA